MAAVHELSKIDACRLAVRVELEDVARWLKLDLRPPPVRSERRRRVGSG